MRTKIQKKVQCKFGNCKKIAKDGEHYCIIHLAQQKQVHPIEKVVRVTEIECLKFEKIDAELRNAIQGIKIKELEINNLRQEYEIHNAKMQVELVNLKKHIEICLRNNKEFVFNLSEKYGINTEDIVIDPETRIIRDAKIKEK